MDEMKDTTHEKINIRFFIILIIILHHKIDHLAGQRSYWPTLLLQFTKYTVSADVSISGICQSFRNQSQKSVDWCFD